MSILKSRNAPVLIVLFIKFVSVQNNLPIMKNVNTTPADQIKVVSTNITDELLNVPITSKYAYWQSQGVEFGNFDQPNSIFNFDPDTGKFNPTWEEIAAEAEAEAKRLCPGLFQERDDDDDLLFKEDENGQYDEPSRPISDCYDEPRWF